MVYGLLRVRNTAEDAEDAEVSIVVSIDAITHRVIKAAITVHSALGAGLLEKAYDACLNWELRTLGLQFDHQLKLPVLYKGIRIETGFRVDYVVEKCVLVEIKAVDKLHPVHSAQLLSYLKLTGLSVGLLVNFNVVHLTDGIRRLVNNYHPETDPPTLRRPW
jgi:GxxExxY protein